MTTFYSLRHKPTGCLAAVRSIGPLSDRNSREFHLILMTDYDAYPQFEVDSAEKAALVLALDTPMYNTTPEKPSWGGLNIDEFEVVIVVTTVQVNSVAVDLPVKFASPIESRKTAAMIASRYLKRQVQADPGSDLWLRFVEVPNGETAQSLAEKCNGKPIIIGPMARSLTQCVGVFDTPEEYVDLFAGKASVGLITR